LGSKVFAGKPGGKMAWFPCKLRGELGGPFFYFKKGGKWIGLLNLFRTLKSPKFSS